MAKTFRLHFGHLDQIIQTIFPHQKPQLKTIVVLHKVALDCNFVICADKFSLIQEIYFQKANRHLPEKLELPRGLTLETNILFC